MGGIAMEFHVAVATKLFGLFSMGHVEVFVLDLHHDLVERFDGFIDVSVASVVGHGWHAVLLSGVINVHATDSMFAAFLDEVGIHFQLSSVAVQNGAVLWRR